MNQRLSPSPSPSPLPSTSSSSSSSFMPSTAISVTADEEPASSSSSSTAISPTVDKEPSAYSSRNESVTIEHQGNDHSTHCKWEIHNFSSKRKSREIWSSHFRVEDFNCRLVVYPKGDSQSLPGYCSIYLKIINESFTGYSLSIVNQLDETNSIRRESWNRYSSNGKKSFHGWSNFALISTLVDPMSGFILNDDVVITADILALKESISINRDRALPVLLTWKVHNFSVFKEMIKTQKIIGPVFHARDISLLIRAYQSNVNGTEYLSMCLESEKKINEPYIPDQSCWCLFRISVKNQKPMLHSMCRDSYGRFAIDSRTGDNSSLGWIDYMKMSDFNEPDLGFLVNDTVVFRIVFQFIKESGNLIKNGGGSIGERSMGGGEKSDEYIGKFIWRIHDFKRLTDLLRKRKLFDLSVKSKRFQIGYWDFRLIVYPNSIGSGLPYHLSLSLEVTDSRNTASDWSCFVSHRLSVMNQKMEEKSIVKESQNRYSKAQKDWGCYDFMQMSSLLDQDAGFLVQDSVAFSAEVRILKETSEIQDFSDQNMELSNAGGQTEVVGRAKRSFIWKLENFSSFKEIMETHKIFSKKFQASGFELRIGFYESFGTFYMYLESDHSAWIDPHKNFWVKYKMGVVNQNNSDRTLWKESTMFTNTWNKSVLEFMKVSDILEGDAGFLLDDTIVFVCCIMDSHYSALVEEFKFNPNAKSFTPPQTPLSPPSPVFDGSNSFPNNVSAVQHMQCLPMGVGIGTSFGRPQFVMYDPQTAPIQSPQAFIHPNAHLAAPIQSPQAFILPNTHLAAPIQSPQAFIHPNAHLVGTSFAGPRPVMCNPQAAPIQSPQAFIGPNVHLAAPIQSPQAFIHPNAHLAAAIQSPQAFICPNAHLLYGQPIIMGHHPRQVLYMPMYPPGGES